MKTFRVAVLTYFGLAALVHFFPNGLIFFPSTYPSGDWTLPPQAKDVFFRAKDGTRLHGWLRWVDPKTTTILVLHGNAGNIAGRRSLLGDLGDLGANVFLIDYRGFGRSEGSPSEEGADMDAEASWDYLAREQGVDPGRIVVLGQSLGCAFATELAKRRPCAALILEAPFSSARDMGGVVLPWLPLGWALGVDMDNLRRIASVHVPVLVVQGNRDTVIPNSLGKRVFDAANEPKRFQCFKGGGHNDLWETCRPAYFSEISAFLSEAHIPFRNVPSP